MITWGSPDHGGNSTAVKNDLACGVHQIYSTTSSAHGGAMYDLACGALAAVKHDGSMITWGSSRFGGDSSAVKNDLASGVQQIYSNLGAFAAVKKDGSVITWGNWDYGGDSTAV